MTDMPPLPQPTPIVSNFGGTVLAYSGGQMDAYAREYAAQVTSDRDALRAFSQAVMKSWPEGDVDGGELQDAAIKHGLLAGVEVGESCGESCRCAGYYAPDEMADGVTCYRRTELLGEKT